MLRALALAVALSIATLAAPAAAAAGFVFVEEGGDETLMQGGRLRMKPRDPSGSSLAIDLGRARMWMADPARRAYWEGSVEEFCTTARGSFRQTLGQAQRVTVERTGETETIAGFATRKYRILADDRLYEELWLTADPAVARELDPRRGGESLGRMMACVLNANPRGGPAAVEDDAAYRKLYLVGWPLRSVYYGRGGASGRSTVERAERRHVNEVEFAPPAGLRQVPLGELLGIEKR